MSEWYKTLAAVVVMASAVMVAAEPPGQGWTLVFFDDFTGGEKELDSRWEAQNAPSSHIMCSRWRENAKVENGLLKLIARKEKRGGQEWTAASLWTKERFKYGYFECRYRYAPATGTNNSFWLMTRDYIDRKQRVSEVPGQFEIDINEGKYPNKIAMNLHNWSGEHWARSAVWFSGLGNAGMKFSPPDFTAPLSSPVTTTRLRLVSEEYDAFRVMELRVFSPGTKGYSDAFAAGSVPNLAATAKVSADSVLSGQYAPGKAVDGKLGNDSRWVSAYGDGPHTLTLTWPTPQTIGAIQLITGWQNDGQWMDTCSDFHFEYWDGEKWRPVPGAARSTVDQTKKLADADNLGRSFHVYGLEWNERELVYYFDGKVIRRIPNTICHLASPVWLSLAIIKWAGAINDDLDGKSMDVDYVKVWQKK